MLKFSNQTFVADPNQELLHTVTVFLSLSIFRKELSFTSDSGGLVADLMLIGLPIKFYDSVGTEEKNSVLNSGTVSCQ